MSDSVYFAAQEPEKTASVLLQRANGWYNQLHTNGYLDKVREMWLAYHGAYTTGPGSAHTITFTGEQGELAQISINHLRNIADNIITMITASRPAFQARATNGDSKSIIQTTLANNLLDYYMREKRLEKYLRTAIQYAVVLGSGFIKMEWNATSGEVYDFNEETQTPIYEGDVAFCNLSPYDVVFDTTKESSLDHDWVLTRSFKNKFDLAAKYPEQEDRIKGLQTKNMLFRYRMDLMAYEDTDDVPVYEFYHKKTESLPEGRYIMFLDTNLVLLDSPMPYRNLPVYRVAPSDILGTPYGYTPMFDLLPIQDAVNSLYSTVLTNQHTFGVQNIYVPRGADIQMKSLEGGLNIIEGNSGQGEPKAMNFTNTPAEVFNFIKTLEQQMEIVSGVNSVARGNPEASLKSGSALAMVQSMAIQFMSGIQQQYIHLIEDVGTGLINILKDFAAVPRIAIIAGKTRKHYVETEFTGDDLSMVNRVIVDVGNAVSKTTAGKMQMASELIQYGIVSTPEEYMTVLNTGQLDGIVNDTQDELDLIRQENEHLLEGKPVVALGIDEHMTHIKRHKAILSDPTVRMQPGVRDAALAHIMEHINLLREVDPALLQILGEQPLGPVGGTPPAQANPADQVNGSMPPDTATQNQEPPPLPNMPSMPSVPAEALANPELQQQMMGNVAQG